MLLIVLLSIIVILYSVYIFYIVRFLNHAFKNYFVYFNEKEENVEEKYLPFHRYIGENLPKLEIYFCAIFLAPLRILNVILILIT